MRNLKRNEKTFYFKNYNGRTPIVDASGYENGEYSISYGTLTEAHGNISSAIGNAQIEMFGNLEGYTKVIVMDYDSGIDENSILFVDSVPNQYGTNYDYVVKRVSKSINVVSLAIAKVETK